MKNMLESPNARLSEDFLNEVKIRSEDAVFTLLQALRLVKK